MVKPDKATRARAPGGSFICPNTNVAFDSFMPALSTFDKSHPPSSIECIKSLPYFIIPDSNISLKRSFPSRVRSPTPAKTESPPWPFAILLINSWIKTVLPTPAPPNKPILPPFAYGSIKSITLIPVNKTSVEVDKSSNLGA